MPEPSPSSTLEPIQGGMGLGQLTSGLLSGPGIAILGCFVLLIVLKIMGPSQKTGVVARARLAKESHRAEARKLACKQIEARVHNEVALYIGTPKGSRFEKVNGKHSIYLPEDSDTIYIPGANEGIGLLGGTGCGKTYSMINPLTRSALDQGFPVIYLDIKYTSDNPNPTSQIAGYAQERGYQTSILAPGMKESCICNPVDFLRDGDDAETARQLAKVFERNFIPAESKGGHPFFEQVSQKMIQGLAVLAKRSRYSDLMMMRSIARSPNLPELVENSGLPELVKSIFDSMVASAGAPETLSGIQSTVSNMLGNLMSPGLLSGLCGKTTMPLDLDGRQLVVFGVDGEREEVVMPILATILTLLIQRNVMRPRKTPLILVLDEIPAIYAPYVDSWLNQRRSAGLVTILAAQSESMIEKQYGKAGTERIMTGCSTQAIFQLNDFPTARKYSDFIGSEDVHYKQKSRSHGKGGGSRSVADHQQTRKVVEINEIREFPKGTCILFNRGYRDNKSVRVPYLGPIKIPQRDIKAVKRSEKLWLSIRAKMIANSQLKVPTDDDLRARNQEALSLFSPAASSEVLAQEARQLEMLAREFATIEDQIDLPEEVTNREFNYA